LSEKTQKRLSLNWCQETFNRRFSNKKKKLKFIALKQYNYYFSLLRKIHERKNNILTRFIDHCQSNQGQTSFLVSFNMVQ